MTEPIPVSLMKHALTRHQAAAYLGFSVRKLDELRAAGGGPKYFRIVYKLYYWRHDLAAFDQGVELGPIGIRDHFTGELTSAQTGRLLGVCDRTMAYWRQRGEGPKYSVTAKGIRYQLADVFAYVGWIGQL